MFGKVKQKITKKEEPSTFEVDNTGQGSNVFVSKGTPASGGIDLALWDPQALGKKSQPVGVTTEYPAFSKPPPKNFLIHVVTRENSKSPPGFGYRLFWIQIKRITSSDDIHDPLKPFLIISRGLHPLDPHKRSPAINSYRMFA